MTSTKTLALLLAGAVASAVACGTEPDPNPVLASGVFAEPGAIRPNATAEERATFERGKAVALRRFTKAEGLGPDFNVTFCAACHEKPTTGGGAARYRQFLLAAQRLGDGSFQFLGKSGVVPHFSLSDARAITPAQTNVLATRVPIPFFGVGLLAEIPDSVILANADPDDKDHDGVRGRPNYDRGFVGRFGRKSQTVSIEGFIRGPLFNHAGITSNPLPDGLRAKLPVPSAATSASTPSPGTRSIQGEGDEVVAQQSQAQAAAPDAPTTDMDGAPDPELSENDLFDLVSFSMLLAAPKADDPTPETEAGRALFARAKCTACHVPALSGPRGAIPAYSDLLIHDMGDELGDGIEMKLAKGNDFRTQPLWGIAALGPYLHDGRADTLDDAIRMHGGEGKASRDAYAALSDAERANVLAFLRSLGGRAQASAGLVPPNAPALAVGAYGGPDAPLDASASSSFLAGRAVFDRDLAITKGLGPRFNGDSCRACHFDPVIGGSGPDDVNVTRQGKFDMGSFTAPANGTMLHRHAIAHGARPEPDPICNFFEPRQTPAVFGLGLIERIDEATIATREDPTDLDGDGVRGRANRLPDGRVGRLGWKAGVPSLAEFARDAMSNELGVTLPAQPGLTFGFATDADSAPDPEISVSDLQALVFFMQRLAPPPRTRANPALEDAGEKVFSSVKCGACHVPSLPTNDGRTANLYSDLLLHDVTAQGSPGIGDGTVKPTEFRTAPLWGLAKTGPYMHHGRAFTIEQAILAHDGEAKASVAAFNALPAGDRAALLAFLQSL